MVQVDFASGWLICRKSLNNVRDGAGSGSRCHAVPPHTMHGAGTSRLNCLILLMDCTYYVSWTMLYLGKYDRHILCNNADR